MTYQTKIKEFAKHHINEEVCELGLIGEFGEVCEKIKKHKRNGNDPITLKRDPEILKELGDVWWYFNMYCSLTSFKIGPMPKPVDNTLREIIQDTTFYLGQLMGFSSGSNLRDLKDGFGDLFNWFEFTREEVEEANILKLTSRLERDVICGEGDNR